MILPRVAGTTSVIVQAPEGGGADRRVQRVLDGLASGDHRDTLVRTTMWKSPPERRAREWHVGIATTGTRASLLETARCLVATNNSRAAVQACRLAATHARRVANRPDGRRTLDAGHDPDSRPDGNVLFERAPLRRPAPVFAAATRSVQTERDEQPV